MMAFDLGIFDQAVWLISQGESPFVTVRGLHILADHFSVILYLLAPLYWLWDSPKALLTAQTLALASGALPVYALAHTRTQSALTALVFAACYLFYPALGWSNVYEFHPDTFATPLLLGAFYYLTQRRWRSYFALLGLVVLTKETVGLTVMALGLYALKTDRRVGWLTLGFGAAALWAALATVRYFNGGAPSAYFWLYAKYGDSLPAIVRYLLEHPFAVVSDLSAEPKRQYLFHLLQPVLFLPLVAPKVLLVAAPALLINLLSNRVGMYSTQGYYAATIMPVIFAAAIIGYERLRRWLSPPAQAVLLANLCVWSAAGSWFSGPLGDPYAPLYPAVSAAEAAEIRQALATITPDASVSAQSALVPHLSHRRSIYTFPNPFHQRAWGSTLQAQREIGTSAGAATLPTRLEKMVSEAPVEYVALCPSTLQFPLSHEAFANCAKAVLQSHSYGIVFMGRSIVLLRRGADQHNGLRLLERFSGTQILKAEDVEKAFRMWTANQPMPP